MGMAFWRVAQMAVTYLGEGKQWKKNIPFRGVVHSSNFKKYGIHFYNLHAFRNTSRQASIKTVKITKGSSPSCQNDIFSSFKLETAFKCRK